MLFLRREQAPLSKAAWARIDGEAERTLRLHLAARRLVDFHGPTGWETSCVNLGRTGDAEVAVKGAEARVRRVLPLLEVRVPFSLGLAGLRDVDRGRKDPGLDPVIEAAKTLARAEDHVVFYGHEATGVVGMIDGAEHEPLPIDDEYERYPGTVARAADVLRARGVAGPYGIALGPRRYAGLVQAPAKGGYPVLDRLKNVVSGPIVWAPALEGAVVFSARGGDFELHVGQDASVAYDQDDDETVSLSLVSSFTFLNLAPEAAIPLRYAGEKGAR